MESLMTKILTISAIITSVILLSGTLGFVLSIPDAFAGFTLSEECQECDDELMVNVKIVLKILLIFIKF